MIGYKAKFIGTDSLGYKHGETYNIIECSPRDLGDLAIHRDNGQGFCPYETREDFLANWEIIDTITTSNYRVYLVSKHGQGHVHMLQDWDGSDILELHLDAFARDAIISIEPDNR